MNDTTAPESNERSLLTCIDGPVTSTMVVWNNLVFGVFNICLTIATILLNSITIVACLKSRLLKYKTAYFMVMMLSFNDLVVGLTSNVLFAAILLNEYSSRRTECLLKHIQIVSLLFFSGCSFKTLVLMSLERYAAICHPLFHRTKVSRKRLMKCLTFFWFVALVATTLSWRFIAFFEYVVIPELLAFHIVLVYIYVRIYLANSRSSKTLNQSKGQQDAHEKTAREQRRQLLLNVKLAKSCCVAVVSYFLCYLPSCIITNAGFKYEKDMAISVVVWAETLILANSSINSIVFFWRSRTLRQEACAVVKQVFCRTEMTDR